MKRILLLLVVVMAFVGLNAQLNYSGNMRSRMSMWNEDVQDDSPTSSTIDTRFRIKFMQEVNEKISATVQFEMGDFNWGDGNAADIGTDGRIIELKHAYLKFACPFMDGNAKVGLQAWNDNRGLIFDDDFAAMMISRNLSMGELQLGWAKTVEGADDQDDDEDLFLINYNMGMFGIEDVIKRSNTGNNIDAWIMPHVIYDAHPMFNLNAMLALNYGMYKDVLIGTELKDVTNMGYALSLNAQTKSLPIDLGIDFLYVSGDDGEDPESTSRFNTISGYYMNGLEYMGFGIHDGVGAGTNVGNGGSGNMDIVVTAAKEVMPNLTAKTAFGMLNTIEDVSMGGTKPGKNLGMEIDFGISTTIQEKISFDTTAAIFMPNKDVWGSDEIVKEISSVISVKF